MVKDCITRGLRRVGWAREAPVLGDEELRNPRLGSIHTEPFRSARGRASLSRASRPFSGADCPLIPLSRFRGPPLCARSRRPRSSRPLLGSC